MPTPPSTPPSPSLPELRRTYQNAVLDSTRWQHVTLRDDDVVVATPYKSGTTWMLNIVRQLIFVGREAPPLRELWIDCRFRRPVDELVRELDAQRHRRYLKTHLALDGLPYAPQVRYIVVGRDVRDVFMSLWNHHQAMVPNLDSINAIPDRVGPPMPPPPDDIHTAWRSWIGRGWFDWEREGYPFWGNMHHVQSWWDYRHLDNILFVHFNELKRDLPGQIGRIARYLDIEVPTGALPDMLQALSVDTMRREAAVVDATWAEAFFRHKGTNGRWREVLSADDLALYERRAAELLDPDCRAWLEGGGAASDAPDVP